MPLYFESEEAEKTTSPDWETKLDATFDSWFDGDLIFNWSAEVMSGESNAWRKPHLKMRVIVDDSDVVNEYDGFIGDINSWSGLFGFKKLQVVKDQSLNIKIQFCVGAKRSGTVGMRRARLRIDLM